MRNKQSKMIEKRGWISVIMNSDFYGHLNNHRKGFYVMKILTNTLVKIDKRRDE